MKTPTRAPSWLDPFTRPAVLAEWAAPRKLPRGRPRTPRAPRLTKSQRVDHEMIALETALAEARSRGFMGTEKQYLAIYLRAVTADPEGYGAIVRPRLERPAKRDVLRLAVRLAHWRAMRR